PALHPRNASGLGVARHGAMVGRGCYRAARPVFSTDGSHTATSQPARLTGSFCRESRHICPAIRLSTLTTVTLARDCRRICRNLRVGFCCLGDWLVLVRGPVVFPSDLHIG